MGSFVRTMQRKQARKMAKEEESEEEGPESGEKLELSKDDIQSLLIDAEVLIRAGAEKIDTLHEAGVIDDDTRAQIDAVWNKLVEMVDES
jgi:hypothetical protein